MPYKEETTMLNGFTAMRREFREQLSTIQYESGVVGPKGEKGDSVSAGSSPPTQIIPGVSVFIDAVSGEVYIYQED